MITEDIIKNGDARYKNSYEITKEQVEYLAERVKVLQGFIDKICKEKIENWSVA